MSRILAFLFRSDAGPGRALRLQPRGHSGRSITTLQGSLPNSPNSLDILPRASYNSGTYMETKKRTYRDISRFITVATNWLQGEDREIYLEYAITKVLKAARKKDEDLQERS